MECLNFLKLYICIFMQNQKINKVKAISHEELMIYNEFMAV